MTKNLPEFQTEIINFLGLSAKNERNINIKLLVGSLNDIKKKSEVGSVSKSENYVEHFHFKVTLNTLM